MLETLIPLAILAKTEAYAATQIELLCLMIGKLTGLSDEGIEYMIKVQKASADSSFELYFREIIKQCLHTIQKQHPEYQDATPEQIASLLLGRNPPPSMS